MWKHPEGEAFWGALMIGALVLLNIFQYTHLKTVNNRLDSAQTATLKAQQDLEQIRQRVLDLENARSAETAPAPIPAIGENAEDPGIRIRELQQQHERLQRQLRAEVQRLRAVTTSTDARISQVSAEVGNVRSDLAAKDQTINHSVAELKRVMGDLGSQSSLIATNRKELETLRASGDRLYYDFTISREKDAKRVSDVGIVLKRTDPKRSRFSIELITSDKRIEKKDRTLNEPIQFYVKKRIGPYEKDTDVLYELVVNEIKSDHVAGYLSTPRGLTR